MYYAQFYQMSVPNEWNNHESKPIEACGDRAVIILDGRQCVGTMHDLAKHACKVRGYVGYTIHTGESFTRSTPITDYRSV